MTVKELIKELQRYPEDHEISIDLENEFGDPGVLFDLDIDGIDANENGIILRHTIEY